jgi:hypothetical protein
MTAGMPPSELRGIKPRIADSRIRSPPEALANAVQADPANPSHLYTMFHCQGVWKSTNYGTTWTGPINTGTNVTNRIGKLEDQIKKPRPAKEREADQQAGDQAGCHQRQGAHPGAALGRMV